MISEWRKNLKDIEKESLQKIYNYFKKNNVWPNSRKVAIELREKGDLWNIAKDIGYPIIQPGTPENKNSKCRLSIFGIALCTESDEDIELFLRFLKVAAKRFIEEPSVGLVTNKDFIGDYSLSTLESSRIIRIVSNTSGIYSGASLSKETGEFSFDLNYNIIEYEKINSFNDFIKLNLDDMPTRFGGNVKLDSGILPEWEIIDPYDDTHRYLEDLDKEERIVEKGYVFILMSMGEEYELREVNKKIREVCQEFGFKAQRVDDIQSSGDITDEILENIKKAEFIVTDLSKERPNVYYELGYAHGFGLGAYDLILIAKEGSKLHFDIQNLRVIYYKDPDEMKEKLKTRFQSLLDVRL